MRLVGFREQPIADRDGVRQRIAAPGQRELVRIDLLQRVPGALGTTTHGTFRLDLPAFGDGVHVRAWRLQRRLGPFEFQQIVRGQRVEDPNARAGDLDSGIGQAAEVRRRVRERCHEQTQTCQPDARRHAMVALRASSGRTVKKL